MHPQAIYNSLSRSRNFKNSKPSQSCLLRSIDYTPNYSIPFSFLLPLPPRRTLTMRLRNFKETIPYTIEDTLRDVHPHTLEEPFHWAASVFMCSLSNACLKFQIKSNFSPSFPLCQVGEPVLVLAGDENGLNRKWRKGYVIYEGNQILTDWVCCSTALVKSINFIPSRVYFTPIVSNILWSARKWHLSLRLAYKWRWNLTHLRSESSCGNQALSCNPRQFYISLKYRKFTHSSMYK